GGAAERRGWHWQIPPGAGTEGACGQRAPGMADAVPVFPLLPEDRLVSHDRPAGTGGPAFRAGGAPAAEAAETGGVCCVVWSATGRGRPPLGRLALAPAAGGLCPFDDVSGAADA